MPAGKKRILIVDDEPEAADSLKDYFQTQGLEVLTATSGEKGLELLNSEKPALVLLDMRLKEGLSGMEVLRRAKAGGSRAQIVVVTAVDNQNVADLAKGLGALDYLTKPFKLEDLKRVVLDRLR